MGGVKMSVIIEPGDPRDPQATALLKQSHALMESLFPPPKTTISWILPSFACPRSRS